MRRIYYSNILFRCNNGCRNCISHSVKEGDNLVMTPFDFYKAIESLDIKPDDIWNINGGEPTLNPCLTEIIELCNSTSKHIILYTNGRTLHKLPFNVIEKIERIIVPIYGDKEFHNKYVNNPNAFQETVFSLVDIIKSDPNKCDIKIFIDSEKQLASLLRTPLWDDLLKNNHFSVTRILTGYKDCNPCDISINLLAEQMIMYLVAHNKIVRFYDLPFCNFSDKFQKYILSIYDRSFDYDPTVLTILRNGRIKGSNYMKYSNYYDKCIKCAFNMICTMIMKKYFCPNIDSGVCTIGIE